MLPGIGGELRTISMTLYTDTHMVRASYSTRQRRISDILNEAGTEFIVVQDAVFDEFGVVSTLLRSDYAQINLSSVLFAVANDTVEPLPELRTPKVAERAMISIPPFKVVGEIHLVAERNLQESLQELTGRFVPVTSAAYWSDRIGEARQTAPMVAVNHARAQILAPHREADPWAGLDRAGEPSARPEAGAGGGWDTAWPDNDRIG